MSLASSKRSNIPASRLNLDVGTDAFLVSILELATTPRNDHWDLQTDANCLGWFYSHVEEPIRPKVDAWNALDIEDFPLVDVSLKQEESCTTLVEKVATLTKRQARKHLDTLHSGSTGLETDAQQGTPSPGTKAENKRAQRKRTREWEQKMYPANYVAPLHDVRTADSMNILIALRKLVRRRELHIKMMKEAVELDWWRVISEDWKAIMRLVTCEIVELVQVWREKIGPIEGNRPWSPKSNQHVRPFRWKGKNYLLKIPTDLDFMTKRSCYGSAQQRNPFLLPFPLESLREIASAEHDQQSWGCRISRAAALLLQEENRCGGSFVWNSSQRSLERVPDLSSRQLSELKRSFQLKGQHLESMRAREQGGERRGLSHDGSFVSANRGSSAGTLGTISRGGAISRGDAISRGGIISRGGSVRRNFSRGRDIFTPGSNASMAMDAPPRTPGAAEGGSVSVVDTTTWSELTPPNANRINRLPSENISEQFGTSDLSSDDRRHQVSTPTGSVMSCQSIRSDEHHLYPSSEYGDRRPETGGSRISTSVVEELDHQNSHGSRHPAVVLEPIISPLSVIVTSTKNLRSKHPPVMLSSLQLSPFHSSSKQRTVTMRQKGKFTPPGYDAKNGFEMLVQCPLTDCAVCDALRVERRVAVYTAKTERSQRLGLYAAMMDSRASMLRDMSATMLQALWRGALVRQRIVRPMYFEDEKVTSDLGGTRMTVWLPNAHATAIRLQRVARCSLSYWELLRRRRAELERVMAVRIQSRYRIRKSKARATFVRKQRRAFEAKQYKAAVGLQNAFRSRAARRLVHMKLKLKQKYDKENGGAETIQRAWRCAQARHAVWLRRASLACVKIQAIYRGMQGYDGYQTQKELIRADHTRIKAAHIRLEHLQAALHEAERREVCSIIQDFVIKVEKIVEAEVQAEAKAAEEEKEAAEALVYERKTGRKKPPRSETLQKLSLSSSAAQKQRMTSSNTIPTAPVNHVVSHAASITDVRSLSRYLYKRSALPSTSENKSPTDVLQSLSRFDDRQIVTRLVLDQQTNEGHDFLASHSIAKLKSEIKEVESFVDTWRKMAVSSYMWHRVCTRYLHAVNRVPLSVHKIERLSSISLAVVQHAHLRSYSTQNMRDNLVMFRRHLVEREARREDELAGKKSFSKMQTELLLAQGMARAEAKQVELNRQHDRSILDKEETHICGEDTRSSTMRNYLTSTTYARIALWETFSTLFDNKSRRELYLYRNRQDKKKVASLDDKAVLPPMEEDGAVIIEHVTISTHEFQEFTRRSKAPVDSKITLHRIVSFLDPKKTGRIPFERTCWWFFSGDHTIQTRAATLHVKSMAQLYLKRKRVLLHRWSVKKIINMGPIKKRMEKKRAKVAQKSFSAEREKKENEVRAKKLADAIREEEEAKVQAKENEYLDKIRFLNDLGDEIWRNMKLDPPYEKHIRPPAWSVELSEAIENAGIRNVDRKPLPLDPEKEDTDDKEDHEEEWEKTAKALLEAGEEGNEQEEEEKDEETVKDEEGGEQKQEQEQEQEQEPTKKKEIKKKQKRTERKSRVFSVPFISRVKVPGNDLRISSTFSRGISEGVLKKQSEKYRKELRKRRKKREKAEAKAQKERDRIAAMTPEERLEYQMEQSRKGKQGKQEQRNQKKKEKEEKERVKRARRKQQKLKRGKK